MRIRAVSAILGVITLQAGPSGLDEESNAGFGSATRWRMNKFVETSLVRESLSFGDLKVLGLTSTMQIVSESHGAGRVHPNVR